MISSVLRDYYSAMLLLMSRLLRVSEFATRVGRSASTVRRWEREGLIRPCRMVSGQRYVTEAEC